MPAPRRWAQAAGRGGGCGCRGDYGGKGGSGGREDRGGRFPGGPPFGIFSPPFGVFTGPSSGRRAGCDADTASGAPAAAAASAGAAAPAVSARPAPAVLPSTAVPSAPAAQATGAAEPPVDPAQYWSILVACPGMSGRQAFEFLALQAAHTAGRGRGRAGAPAPRAYGPGPHARNPGPFRQPQGGRNRRSRTENSGGVNTYGPKAKVSVVTWDENGWAALARPCGDPGGSNYPAAGVEVFGGTKALSTFPCRALLDTGSPSSFIQQRVVDRMLACGALSADGIVDDDPIEWGGFHGVPLWTLKRIRLNLHMWRGGATAPRQSGPKTACLVVFSHVVPDCAMKHELLLGRDSWSAFPERTYRAVTEDEEIITLQGANDLSRERDAVILKWTTDAISLVEIMESPLHGVVVLRFAGDACTLPGALSWVTVSLTNSDGTAAEEGLYYVTFLDGWSPSKLVVEAGVTDIPLQREGERGRFSSWVWRNQVGAWCSGSEP